MPIENQSSDTGSRSGVTDQAKNNLTISSMVKYILKGSVMGATEVSFTHPFWVIKTRIQNREKFTLKPPVLYRGIGLNLASTLPITAIQVATTQGLDNLSRNAQRETPTSPLQKMLCSFVGGSVSAVVSTGSEMVMSHMQKSQGFWQTVQTLKRLHGLKSLYTGFYGTAMREGIYTLGFMGLPQIVEQQMNASLPDYSKFATLCSGPMSGLLAAVASHPFDTVKTRQQSLLHKNSSFLKTTKDIIKNEGFLVLYRGLTPRAVMVTSAVTIMDRASKEWDKKFASDAVKLKI